MAQTNGELVSIGEAAKLVGIAATALRYYERERVLTPTIRSASGYRLYDQRAVERLKFIRAAQAVGFTLDDVRLLLDLDGDGGKQKCKSDVQRLIESRLTQVEQKMSDLRRVQAALKAALRECRRSAGENCPVLVGLRIPRRKRPALR